MLKRKKRGTCGILFDWWTRWGGKKICFPCAAVPQITGLKLPSDNKFVSTENILTSYDA